MRLHPDLQEATFVARQNRFAAIMRHDGKEKLVHIANSGRLKELLRPENPMLLAPAPQERHRKTAYDLVLVEVNGVLVSADARLPDTLFREAVESGRLQEFIGHDSVVPEVTVGHSRVDFLLSGRPGLCYVEVKSVTLVEDGTGLFPDAPTERGSKHLLTLQKVVECGHRATVVFVIQRPDAEAFSPNEAADPEFCQTLKQAARRGVEVHAYTCAVDRSRIELSDAVPVRLG